MMENQKRIDREPVPQIGKNYRVLLGFNKRLIFGKSFILSFFRDMSLYPCFREDCTCSATDGNSKQQRYKAMKKIGESRKNKAGQTAAKVKADKAEKRTGRKAAAVADNATERELLREVVKGLGVIADRVESVRRTLWRMSEVRNYENMGGKGEPLPEAEKRKQEITRLLGEIYYPMWEGLVKDIKSGRIDTAPEYAEFRALPEWGAFRESLKAVAEKPDAAGAGKPKAKGGKR